MARRSWFVIGFLFAQAVGAAVWWCLLLAWPPFRGPFLAKGAPDSTLMAFFIPDALFFILSSGAAAYGFLARRSWAWPLLCIHAGVAAYAALYCWSLAWLTGGNGLLGAVLMTPSLIVPGVFVWRLRPMGGERS